MSDVVYRDVPISESLMTDPCKDESEEVSGKLGVNQLGRDVDVGGQCFCSSRIRIVEVVSRSSQRQTR